MRIISKYKDFYDYMMVGGIQDDTNTYIRTAEFLNNDNDTTGIGSILSKEMDKFLYTSEDVYINKNTPTTRLDYGFRYLYIGITPHIYKVPLLVPIYNLSFEYAHDITKFPVFLVKPEKLMDYDNFVNSLPAAIDGVNIVYPKNPLKNWSYHAHTYLYKIQDSLQWAIESSKIFETLGCPVFVYSKYGEIPNIFDKRVSIVPTNNTNVYKKWFVIKNPIIQNIMVKGISSYIMGFGHNIYDDIENFLYSSKEMKIEEPNNNIKIVNAGFDIKTSFRNM